MSNRAHILQAQIEQTKTHITYWNASIVSGHYKLRSISVRDEQGKSRYLSEVELLRDAMNTLKRHVDHLNKLSDLLIEECDA